MRPTYTSQRSGMTLIEMVLALAIFVLIAAGVQRIVGSTMQGVSAIRESGGRDAQVHAFFGLIRDTLRTLPGPATFETVVDETSSSRFPLIALGNAPAAFALGSTEIEYRRKLIGVERQLGGLYRIVLKIEPEEETGLTRPRPVPPPLPLLTDLQDVQWRFLGDDGVTWIESWSGSTRPKVIRIQLLFGGESVPRVALFALSSASGQPTAPSVGNRPPPASPTPAPTPKR